MLRHLILLSTIFCSFTVQASTSDSFDVAISYLNIKKDGIYVDCTLGGGGHSFEILKRLETGHLYSFDQEQSWHYG